VQQQVFQNTKLIYIPGKGRHLVPVIVPHDTVEPLKLLADPSVCKYSSVLHRNCHLFTSTHLSEDNADGWHAVQRVCSKVAIPVRNINANKVRHHVSTLYAVSSNGSTSTHIWDTRLPWIPTSTRRHWPRPRCCMLAQCCSALIVVRIICDSTIYFKLDLTLFI